MTSICFDAEINFLPASAGAITRTVGDRLREEVSILDFIPAELHPAILDYTSTVNVSEHVQAAIDALNAAGGGIIEHPHGLFNVSGVLLKTGVALVGTGTPGTYGYGNSPISNKTVYHAVADGWILELADGSSNTAGVCGVDFRGLGAGTAAKGVRIGTGSYWCFIKNCQFNSFSGQALVLAGLAGVAEDILATNCLLTTPTVKTGIVEVAGTDNYGHRIESAGSAGTVTNAGNLYVRGIAVTGSNNFLANCIGETADVGIYVSGNWNKFTGVRADLNWGHGWEISGSSNLFSASHGHANGKATANTFDNWTVSGNNNLFGACMSSYTVAPLPRYSLRDTTNGDSQKNLYGSDCSWGVGFGTATFNFAEFAGGAVQVPNGPRKTFAAQDTTPSVLGYKRFITANGSTTAITDFDDAVPGQEIEVFVFDNHTSFVNGTMLLTAERTTKKAVNGQWYLFVYENGVWSEKAGAQAFRASATFNPGSLAAAASTAIQTIAVPGAALGDKAEATFSADLAGADIHAWVSAADTVSYFFQNVNGANPLVLGSGTVKVAVRPG